MKLPDYIKRLLLCFSGSFINVNNEIILSSVGNVWFQLEDVDSYEDCVRKCLWWCSRSACKDMPYGNNRRLNRRFNERMRINLNNYLGKNFTEEDWELIYARLGNGVNEELTTMFVKVGLDIEVLKGEL